MKSAIYNLTSDVAVTSSEKGLTPNLHTASAGDLGKDVHLQSYAFLCLRAAEILSEK